MRLQTTAQLSFSQNVKIAFRMLVLKSKIIAVARFTDGSRAEFWLISPFVSDMPYQYVEGSAEDVNGNVIVDPASNTSWDDSGESYYFSNYTSLGTIELECIITWTGTGNSYTKDVVCYYSG